MCINIQEKISDERWDTGTDFTFDLLVIAH